MLHINGHPVRKLLPTTTAPNGPANCPPVKQRVRESWSVRDGHDGKMLHFETPPRHIGSNQRVRRLRRQATGSPRWRCFAGHHCVPQYGHVTTDITVASFWGSLSPG